MSLRINNNVEALNAHRNLAQNDQLLAKSMSVYLLDKNQPGVMVRLLWSFQKVFVPK